MDIKLREIVSAFEAAIWRTTRDVFGNITHRGCVFHWTQGIRRHMQEPGLAPVYVGQDAVLRYCRRIMALPFLPQDRIVDEFERIEARANSASMIQLTSYVRKPWTNKTVIVVVFQSEHSNEQRL